MTIAQSYFNLLDLDDDELFALGKDEYLDACIGCLDLGQGVKLVGFSDHSSLLSYKNEVWVSDDVAETGDALLSLITHYPHLARAVLNLKAMMETKCSK